MTTRRTELLDIFKKAASSVAERELPSMSGTTAISALGIDSLAMLEAIGAMEHELNVLLPSDELFGIETVDDLLTAVERQEALDPGKRPRPLR
jgi:acyl carrier protein